MARQKRNSTVIEAARRRLEGLKSITPKPNYGPGLTETAFEQDIVAAEALLAQYNQMLSQLDELQNQLAAAEKVANDKSKRILAATEATYGPDSNEYEMVGGTRLSDRKKPGKKKGGGSGGTGSGTGGPPST
jgi:hypothetical protein